MSGSTNDITHDRLVSKKNSQEYKDNWDKIFGKTKKKESEKKDK